MLLKERECCRSEEIAAYLDGELDAASLALFEKHLQECRSCVAELQEQRRLLCALDFALGADDPNLSLPQNFAQVVAAHAESDMRGVRRRGENKLALRLATGLAVIAFLLLGGARLSDSVLAPVKAVVRHGASVLALGGNTLYDAGAGLSVVFRALGRRFIFESHPIGLIAFLLFAVALVLLPRLIVRYHRAENH